jgi:hypothetical protein
MKCFDLEKSDPKTESVRTMLGSMPCLFASNNNSDDVRNSEVEDKCG